MQELTTIYIISFENRQHYPNPIQSGIPIAIHIHIHVYSK